MANVLTVTGKKVKDKISFSGTTEDEVLAVSCSLRDKDGKESDFNSVVVEDNKFSGEFSKTDGEEILCANYDGGEIVSAKVEVIKAVDTTVGDDEEKETEAAVETEGAAGTGDTGFFTAENSFAVGSIGAILVVAVLGAVLVFRHMRRSQKTVEGR